MNFPSMRVTSLPFNKVVYLPDTLKSREEVKLAAYKTEVMELVKRYIADNCAKDGKQNSNLTEVERVGIQSIKERCKSEDLVVMETDKSKRLSLMTMDNYIAVTESHITEDRVIDHDIGEITNIRY